MIVKQVEVKGFDEITPNDTGFYHLEFKRNVTLNQKEIREILRDEDGLEISKHFVIKVYATKLSRLVDVQVTYNRNGINKYQNFVDNIGSLLRSIRIVCSEIKSQVRFERSNRKEVKEMTPVKKKIEQLLKKRKDVLRLVKNPKHKGRHVGIEVEFFSPFDRNKLIDKLAMLNLERSCNLVTDGSLHWESGPEDERMHGHELRILVSEKRMEQVKDKLKKFFSYAKADVNKTCGLHVHLDARTRKPQQMYTNLVHVQPLLYGMNPASRLSSSYCKRTLDNDWYNYNDRYFGINKESYSKHKTIEVRIGGGSTNVEKIFNWVELLTRIVDTPKEIDQYVFYPSQLKKFVYITNKLDSYIMDRWSTHMRNRTDKIFEAFGFDKKKYLSSMNVVLNTIESEVA